MTAIRHNVSPTVSPTVCPVGTTTRDSHPDVQMYQNQNQNQTVLTVSCGLFVAEVHPFVKAVEGQVSQADGGSAATLGGGC